MSQSPEDFVSDPFVEQDESLDIEKGIHLAQQNLLRLQNPEGYWVGELIVDSTLCSDYILYMHWDGAVDPVLQEKCVQHIRRRQLSDGGWNIYVGGPSEINASVKAYFALKLAGHSPNSPWMKEARAAVLRLGGIPQMNTYAKLYLALLGQFPWKYLPTIPVEVVLFPNWLFFNIYEMSSWSRAMLMPLAIINHYRPTKQLPAEMQLHELYPVGTEQQDFSLPRDERLLTWRNFFLRCDAGLKLLHKLSWKPFRRTALAKAEAWMVERMGEGSDGLAAVFPAMLNSIIALKTLGYKNDDPRLKKAVADFEGLFVDDPEDFRIQLQRLERDRQHEIARLQNELLIRGHLDGAHEVLEAGAVSQVYIRMATVLEDAELVAQPKIHRAAPELLGWQLGGDFDFPHCDVALDVYIRQNHWRASG